MVFSRFFHSFYASFLPEKENGIKSQVNLARLYTLDSHNE